MSYKLRKYSSKRELDNLWNYLLTVYLLFWSPLSAKIYKIMDIITLTAHQPLSENILDIIFIGFI